VGSNPIGATEKILCESGGSFSLSGVIRWPRRVGSVVSPAARGRLRFEPFSVSNLVSEVSRLRRDMECLVQIPSGLRRRSFA
jgi:hypothetical protein